MITNIAELRKEIYEDYDFLEFGKRQRTFSFPEFKEQRGLVYWSGPIDDKEELEGTSYFLGRIISREVIDIDNNYIGIVADTSQGIELFENYTGREFRPILIIPGDRGLIADLTELTKRANHTDLRGKSPEEIIRINFDAFPILMEKKKYSKHDDYLTFFLEKFGEEPILY